jgi:hypothetical protein
MREKKPRRLQRLGGSPGVPLNPSKALLGFFSLIPAFPWSPWNSLELAEEKPEISRLW